MTEKIKGACLCGKVRFEIGNKFSRLYLCHCQQCQKLWGSDHAANLFGEVGSLRWLCGENLIERFDHPGREFTNAFCRLCGSGVPYLNRSGTAIVVRAGSLDGKPAFEAANRIFFAERSHWAEDCESIKPHAGFA